MSSDVFDNLLVLLVNLDRSPERLANMTERLSQFSFKWERLSAVDGGLLPELCAAEVDEKLYEKRHGKLLARAEVGCYLSHIRAMQQFLESDKTHLLVCEDDACFQPDFEMVLEQLLQNEKEGWDVVKLSGFHNPRLIYFHNLYKEYVLGVPMGRHRNTAAVVYNRHGAAQFVKQMLPMSLPFDHALELPWLYDAKLRVVEPSPVHAGDGTESTIVGTKTRKFKWYRRLSTYVFRLKTDIARIIWAISSKS